MSIVPYNSNNEIVFHDPAQKILVIHDNQQNSILLVRALPFDQSEHEHVADRTLEWPESEMKCPHCGSTYTESRSGNLRADYRRRKPRTSFHEPDLGNYVSSAFMHNDYFKLLANLPFDWRSIRSSESLPQDIFNQGYFERFFRKVPPGILGSGAHAQVYKVMHVLKNVQLGIFAVKRINIGDYVLYLDHVLNEVLILYEVSAEGANENNLIRYNHVWMEMGAAKELNTILLSEEGRALGLEDEVPYVFILQQYCDGGHLETLIGQNFQKDRFMSAKEKVEKERQKRRTKRIPSTTSVEEYTSRKWLSDFEIWKFFSDIVNGVKYLHSRGIIHRDLKPSNCLLEENFDVNNETFSLFSTVEQLEEAASKLPKVLVSDFGEGKFIDKQHLADLSLNIDHERRGNTGTIEFTDPKLWIYSHYEGAEKKLAYDFTKSSDIYSLGMILCYLCLGCLPFENEITDRNDPEKIRREIASWHQMLLPQSFHEWFSLSVKKVQGKISECLHDFEILIYMLIETDGTLSAQKTMQILDKIKFERFLTLGLSLGNVEDLAMSNYTKDDELSADESLLNLTVIDLANSENYLGKHFELKSNTFAVAVGVLNLALLEMAEPSPIIKMAKVFNLTSLAISTKLDSDVTRFITWIGLTVTVTTIYLSWVQKI